MPTYIAKADGFLCGSAQYIKEGQTVSFPEGYNTDIFDKDPQSWLVNVDAYKAPVPLRLIGATPVVPQNQVKAHELQVTNPAYDDNMANIIARENKEDGNTVVVAGAPEAQPIVSDAPVTTDAPVSDVVPVLDPNTGLPLLPTTQGTGNLDVL